MHTDEYIEKNRKAWDEVTPVHTSHRTGEAQFYKDGSSTLDHVEKSLLPDLRAKKVAHLCCNCGQDTLSMVNLGATCVGFDFSNSAIEEAIRLSEDSGVKAEFVKANVLDIPDTFNGKFDLVYISRGVLVWIPDLRALMRSVARLLRKGGKLFLYDQHPFAHLFDADQSGDLVAKFDYFKKNPDEYKGLDYVGGTMYDASPNYQFMVRLSDIFEGIAESGMRLENFKEFNHSFFEQFPGMVKNEDGLFRFPEGSGKPAIPFTMVVTATKV